MTKNNLVFLIFFLLTGCGFASGLYKDILKAQDYISAQNFKKAVEVYEDILDKKPSKSVQIKIHYQLGEVYSLYLQEYQKSLSHFSKILEVTEDPLWVVKATEKIAFINYENLRNYNAAKRAYQSLIDFRPQLEKVSEYKYKLAETYVQQKDYKNGLETLNVIIKKFKGEESVEAYYLKGLIYFYLKQTDNAVGSWFEYLKREKRKDKIVQTKFMIANAYESAEKLKEAYNIYYSILGDYPNPEVIKKRLDAIYQRRIARKR